MASVNLANRLCMAGRLEESTALLDAALQVDPRLNHVSVRAIALYNYAYNRVLAGDTDAAIPLFLQAREMCSNYYSPLFGLGVAYAAKGEYATAVEYFETLLGYAPTYPQARLWLERTREAATAAGNQER